MSKNECNYTETRREDWETPQWLFDGLNEIFDFHVDLAAHRFNTKCKEWISRGGAGFEDTFYVYEGGLFNDDLLNIKIEYFPHDRWSWCNPPYGRNGCGDWMDRILQVPNTVSLIPASVGSKWFKEQCWDKADVIVFLHGRLTFEGAPCTAQFDSCLVVKGDILTQWQIDKLARFGRVVPIRGTIPMKEVV